MSRSSDAVFPDEPVEEERSEQLPNDHETPFRPAEDAMNADVTEPERRHDRVTLDDTHQVTDTNMQSEEVYDEGYSGAAEANEPSEGNAVVAYDPSRDQRLSSERGEIYNDLAEESNTMDYPEFISTVQEYDPDLNDADAEDTLQMAVELIAVHLSEAERREVAYELPGRLQDIALSVLPSSENVTDDLVDQAMDLQGIDEHEARNRLRAAWSALKDGLSERLISIIQSKLPSQTLTVLEA